ncbi:MAG: 50S ribosomal protein L24 [Bacteroidia bacterium]|jgi:large subunit ribosomal protein L24|nr:50S ribosomal protein L24 [Bacteroidia bacterium]
MKLHIKKGDTVTVIAGDDKGKTGRVLKVYPEDQRALIEGVNIVTKHRKPTAQNTSGSIDKIEAPVHISNLMLTVDGTPTRVGRKPDENGKLQRVAKKSGEFVK